MNPIETQHYKKALKFVQRIHAKQKRAGDVPVWHHLARVSRQLNFVLNETKEGTEQQRLDIVTAALGHDSLEDTDVTKPELLKVFGAGGVAIIEGMTNTWGDDHPKEYVEKVAGSSESVRLVKMSDNIENLSSVALNLNLLGLKWADEYFTPIIAPMFDAMIASEFTTFVETSKKMKFLMAWARQLYENELTFCRFDKQAHK